MCFFPSLLMWPGSLWSLTQKGCPKAHYSNSPLRPQTKHLFRIGNQWQIIFPWRRFYSKIQNGCVLDSNFTVHWYLGNRRWNCTMGFTENSSQRVRKWTYWMFDVSKKSDNFIAINQLYFIFQCYSSHHHINGGVLLALVSTLSI